MGSFKKIKVGISIGDPNGVGIEVILKTFGDKKMFAFFVPIVFGNYDLIRFQRDHFNFKIQINSIKEPKEAIENSLNLIDVYDKKFNVKFGKSQKDAGKVSLASLEASTYALKKGFISLLVTAPINKNNIQSNKFNFKGHTQYFESKLKRESIMLMISDKLKIGLITDHLPLNKVVSSLSEDLINKKIRLLYNSLKKDFKIFNPKIAVLSINPHVGDNGVIGVEDDEILIPILNKIKKKLKGLYGPFSSDSFFGSKSYLKYDAVIAIYHDQGLIPFKTLSFGKGVNFTAGLNKIRTSPDHGTGYEIAGKGIASKKSFVEALNIAKYIFINRSL
jgi:4-hydroxythreonine-4-phosphate dehydrogenase